MSKTCKDCENNNNRTIESLMFIKYKNKDFAMIYKESECKGCGHRKIYTPQEVKFIQQRHPQPKFFNIRK